MMDETTWLERVMLGALLREQVDEQNQASRADVLSWLRPEHFILPAHRYVYEAIRAGHQRHSRIDVDSVMEELGHRRLGDAVGGRDEVQALISALQVENVIQIARMIERSATKRQSTTSAMLRDTHQAHSYVSFDTVAHELVRDLIRMETKPMQIDGLKTGYHQLDEVTNGLQPGDLIVLAACSGMGKTNLALSIAASAGGAGIFSLHLSRHAVARRLLVRYSHMDASKIFNQILDQKERSWWLETIAEKSTLPIWIDDTPGLDIASIQSRAHALCTNNNVRLLVVEDLRFVHAHGTNRVEQMNAITRGLKRLACDLAIPVLALWQVPEMDEARVNKVPKLSDFGEFECLERDADLVLVLYRDNRYEKDRDSEIAEVHLLRKRDGLSDAVGIMFDRRNTSFYPMRAHI